MPRGSKKTVGGERLLAASTTPAYVVDASRRVLVFNAGCEALTGWTAAEILGQTCHYASDADSKTPATLASSLCPPPEVFEGAELSVPAYIVHRNGTSLPRMLRFQPLRDARNKVSAILSFITPIQRPAPPTVTSPTQQLHAELAALRGQLRTRFGDQTVVCHSHDMAKILNQVKLAQQSEMPVSLEGEPGTGKEHLARVIHYGGSQRANWFVPLDCQRMTEDELEIVFGRLLELHLETPRAGARLQPGTVYLADVEQLPRELQIRLCDGVREQGGHSASLRLIASSSTSLKSAMQQGKLRPELFALLTPLTLELPPLREREAELPMLAQHFLEDANRLQARQLNGFAEDVWLLFSRYDWPGNLDELNQVIREACAQTTDAFVKAADLPFRFRSALDAQSLPPSTDAQSLPLDSALEKVETNLIQIALERSRYNKSKAADILGINRARLYRRMEQLGIEDREATDV